MLNLNAMFGSCESILESEASPRKPVRSTELQMMEMEISTDLAQAEVDSSKATTIIMQLDQILNMYNHVKRFGIDRTFLSLYNDNGQLDSMIGIKFPSCESVDCMGYSTSSYSQLFIAAMEDEKEGIFAKIGKGIKWIWEKIKELCTKVWNKIMSWFSSGDTAKRLEKCQRELQEAAKKKSSNSFFDKLEQNVDKNLKTSLIGRIKEDFKKDDTVGVVGDILTRPLMYQLKVALVLNRFARKHKILTLLTMIAGLIATCVIGVTVTVSRILKAADENAKHEREFQEFCRQNDEDMKAAEREYEEFARQNAEFRKRNSKFEYKIGIEDYTANSSGEEKSIRELSTGISGLDTKLNEACETERVNVNISDAIIVVKDTIDIEKAISSVRGKLDAAIKKIAGFTGKVISKSGIQNKIVSGGASIIQNAIKKLMQSLFKAESAVRKVCDSVEKAIAKLKH